MSLRCSWMPEVPLGVMPECMRQAVVQKDCPRDAEGSRGTLWTELASKSKYGRDWPESWDLPGVSVLRAGIMATLFFPRS